MTDGGVLLMGRATYESIPASKRHMPGRESVVLSGSISPESAPGVSIYRNEDELLTFAQSAVEAGRHVYVIGGVSVYRIAFEHLRDLIDAVIITHVNNCGLIQPEKDGKELRYFDASWLAGFGFSLATGTYIHKDWTYNHVLWTRRGN